MNTSEVLAFLGISRTTLYRWISAGRVTPLPPRFPAKHVSPLEFYRADIESLARGE